MSAVVTPSRGFALRLAIRQQNERYEYAVRPVTEQEAPGLSFPLRFTSCSTSASWHIGYDRALGCMVCTCTQAGNIGECCHIEAAIAAGLVRPDVIRRLEYLAEELQFLRQEREELDRLAAEPTRTDRAGQVSPVSTTSPPTTPTRPDPEPKPNPYNADAEPQPHEIWNYINPKTNTPEPLKILSVNGEKVKAVNEKGRVKIVRRVNVAPF